MNLLNFRQPKASCRLSKDSKIMILFSFVSFLSTLYMYLLFFSLLQVLFISRQKKKKKKKKSNIQGAWGGVSCAALYCVRVAQAERTDTECCNRASIVQATESACTLRILHGILTESVLHVRRLRTV